MRPAGRRRRPPDRPLRRATSSARRSSRRSWSSRRRRRAALVSSTGRSMPGRRCSRCSRSSPSRLRPSRRSKTPSHACARRSSRGSRTTRTNFAESRRSATTLFSDASYYRLRRIKAIVDPADLIRSNTRTVPAFWTAAAANAPAVPGRRGCRDSVGTWTWTPSRSGCSAASSRSSGRRPTSIRSR